MGCKEKRSNRCLEDIIYTRTRVYIMMVHTIVCDFAKAFLECNSKILHGIICTSFWRACDGCIKAIFFLFYQEYDIMMHMNEICLSKTNFTDY